MTLPTRSSVPCCLLESGGLLTAARSDGRDVGRLRETQSSILGASRDGWWCAVGGYVRAANEGDAYDWRGARVVIKASGEDTFGQLGVMESTYPPGLSVPAHTHAGEDEMFYLLDGELRGFCDDDRWTATSGSFVFVPRDRPHGFVVTSDGPARALVIVGPSRLDRQVVANGTPVPRGAGATPQPRP
jgi:quercetin dioxygenase-like cupin family protein